MSNESFDEYQGKSGVVMAVMSSDGYMVGMMSESYENEVVSRKSTDV